MNVSSFGGCPCWVRLVCVFAVAGLVGASGCGGTEKAGDVVDSAGDARVPDTADNDSPGADLRPGDAMDVSPDSTTDGRGDAEVEPDDVDVVPQPLKITDSWPTAVPAGSAVDFVFAAEGGTPPYGPWTLTMGDLPASAELDADSGRLSGTVDNEGNFYFVVQVTDSKGEVATALRGLRVGDVAQEGPMLQRARKYQEIYEKRHLWHGYSYGNWKPDAEDGNLQLSTYGDASFVSGQCTMAMSYRYAVEKTPEALAVVTKQVDGLRFFQRMTGVPGLIGRSFSHKDDPSENGQWDSFEPGSERYQGTGEFQDWYWQGSVSRDQASGAVLGIAAAYDLVDDEHVKETAAAIMTDLADHVWDHNLDFYDPDGKPTKYGNVDGEILEGWPVPNGLNAVCSLSWFKIAAHVSGETRFSDYYQELAFDRDYVNIMKDYMWVYAGWSTKWYNTYIAWENFFHLMRLEDDPVLREKYKSIFKNTLWLIPDASVPSRRGIAEWNPVKTTWYLYSTGETDNEALYRALWMVEQFPEAPLRDRKVTNSLDPNIEINPDRPDEALYPIPPASRIPDMVIWHRGPFTLDGGDDSDEERTGCDYMLPYWMGRYYGYIRAEW